MLVHPVPQEAPRVKPWYGLHIAEGSLPTRKPKKSPFLSSDPTERAVLRYLARRDRTEAQVVAFLEHQGTSPGQIRVWMTALRRRGYVNDGSYALRWARARLTRRPMGRERLEAELLGQGLERDNVLRALDQLYGEVREPDLARDLLKRRDTFTRSRRRAWQAGLLRRHGFDEETIRDVLGERSTS